MQPSILVVNTTTDGNWTKRGAYVWAVTLASHGPFKFPIRKRMQTKENTVAEARLFLRLGLLSFLGFVFYYAHLFFGLLDNVVLFKALAITFLLATVPLPIIAVNNKKLFPELSKAGKTLLSVMTALLLFHHFIMTFIFVLFLRGEGMF